MGNKKVRFVVTLTALLVVGFVFTSVASYYAARQSISAQVSESTLPLTSDNIYSEIQRDLLQPIFISSLMAHDTFVRDWVLGGEEDQQRMVRYLDEIQRRYGTVTAFFVSHRTRQYYHSSGVLKQVSPADPQDQWYFRVAEMNAPFEINVDTDTADAAALTIFINYRVHDYNGNYIGATGVGLAVEAVRSLIETYQQRYGRRIFFIDRNGDVTLHGTGFTGPTDIRERPGLKSLATRILTSPGGSFTYELDGVTNYVNARLVPEFGWYLLVEQREDQAAEAIRNTLWINLLISLGIGGIVLILANLTIGGYQRRLETMATTDKLTGIANRHSLEMLADQAVNMARRRGEAMSAVIADIDNFKDINDRLGHPAGDAVIRAVADALREQVRASDTLARWGGEEFLILLPNCEATSAVALAEKFRRAVAERVIVVDGTNISVSASFGVAALRDAEDYVELIKRADMALYAAKEAGRNRVESAA